MYKFLIIFLIFYNSIKYTNIIIIIIIFCLVLLENQI